MYYVFYEVSETTWELLGKATTKERADELKEYNNKKHKFPMGRIHIVKMVG